MKQRIQQIQEEINKLEKDKQTIIKEEINKDISIGEKFKIFIDYNLGDIVSDLSALQKKSPFLRDYLRNNDDMFGRRETVDFYYMNEDDLLWFMYDWKDEDGEETDLFTDEDKEKISKLAEEMVNNNIRGVIYDW